VLWATHLVDEVDNNDQIVLLDKGLVLAQGTTDELLRQRGVESIEQLLHLQTTPESVNHK